MLNNYHKFKLINLIIILLFTNISFADNITDNSVNSISKQYPEYQIEVIVFSHPKNKVFLFNSNNNQAIEEAFSEHSGNLNKYGTVNFISPDDPDDPGDADAQEPVKLLLRDQYLKLKNSNYNIILHQATKYNILPSQRNKKFFIQNEFSDDEYGFKGVLVITPIKNAFNLSLDGIFNNFRLTKSAKIKNKEMYYFDHPKFGVLVTMVEVK